jgi:hypothetical protein
MCSLWISVHGQDSKYLTEGNPVLETSECRLGNMLTGPSRIVTPPAHYEFVVLNDSHMPWSNFNPIGQSNNLKSTKTKDSESMFLW